jgi:pyruvate,water dikinase
VRVAVRSSGTSEDTEGTSFAGRNQTFTNVAGDEEVLAIDPSTGDPDRMVIEAAFGQGEMVVSGQIEPDTYVLSKSGPRMLQARIGTKSEAIVRGPDGHDQRVTLDSEQATRRVLSDEEAIELARLGMRVEEHYGSHQDVEWAVEKGKTYLWYSRVRSLRSRRPPQPRQRWAGCWFVVWPHRQDRRPEPFGCCSRPRTAPSCAPARCWWLR